MKVLFQLIFCWSDVSYTPKHTEYHRFLASSKTDRDCQISSEDIDDHFTIDQSLDPAVVTSAAVSLLSDVLQPALLGLLSLWLLAGGFWAFLTHLSINSLRYTEKGLECPLF